MKLEDRIGNVSISAGMKVTNFRIKVNKHSFKQLYSGLYSDKIHAIIRELSTNAADAHVSAGKSTVPFEVHLPSEMEPYFSVKDYGTGLSPEQIAGENGIYITFFESDKAHSDDFTGCLGLGSKSPFAYTDNFMVESRYNGKKYSYACFHNESGEPCIAQMAEADTDEPNGLKVEFAVKSADFYQFHGNAEKVLSWFAVKPIVFATEFEFKKSEYLRSTERYGVCKSNRGHTVVIMGNVGYDVNSADFSYSNLNDVERKVLEWGVDLFVDIGDVEFVPSREKLAMTDKTIAGVRKYLGDAIKSIQEELESAVQKAPTVWQARRMLHDIKHSILGKVRSMTSVMYNGKEISEVISIAKMDPILVGTTKLDIFTSRKSTYRQSIETTLYCDDGKIYLNDLEHGGFARVKNDMRDNNIYTARCVSSTNADFLKETGIGEVAIRTSTLPKPTHAKRASVNSDGVQVKRTVVQEYIPSNSQYAADWWKDVEIDLKDGGVYVVVSYGQIIVDEKTKFTPQNIQKRYTDIKAMKPDFRLFAIRPAHLERMGKHQQRWVKLQDYINNLMVEKKEFAPDALAASQYYNCSDHEHYDGFMEYEFEDHSLFGDFIEKMKYAKKQNSRPEVTAYLSLNNYATVKSEFLAKRLGLQNLQKEVLKNYPLLSLINWWELRHNSYSPLCDYISAMDDRKLDGIVTHRPSVREAEVHLGEAV